MNKMNKGAFKEDERYKQANREALVTLVLFLLNFIWWYGYVVISLRHTMAR
jgi:uncharacterized membrane protein YhdT